MYEDPCPHGYIPRSCAECRRAAAARSDPAPSLPTVDELWAEFRGEYGGQAVGALTARRAAVLDETARLESFGRRSKAQDVQLARLFGEAGVLDALIGEKQVAARSAEIADIQRTAQQPGNREGGADTGRFGDPYTGQREWGGGKSPALVRQPGTRLETPQEVISRAGNPWRDGGGPLAHETGAGLVSRAHTAIEAMSERLTHYGAEKLANMLSARPSTLDTVYEIRSEEDIARSAELILALSSPFYESAMRSVFRRPEAFRNGTGVLMWSDEERQAYHDVMVSRAALIEDTGTGGQYLLPLVLDDTVVITNASSANPWRRVCRTVTTTSKTWNGVTTAGATAAWTAEGATATDGTPTLGALVLTPLKEAAWLMASVEEQADSAIAQNVPALLSDAFARLESAGFATGAGTTVPKGAVAAATVDTNTGLVSLANAASVFPLLAALPPRFRVGDQAKPYWACNITILNALRGVAPFAAATTSIVNDATSDGVPEMFGYDVLESSDMDAVNTTGGHKNLLFFDAMSFLICERLGTTVVYEPLVASSGGILPSGVVGWFAYRRVTSDCTTATALRVHNNV